MSWILLRAVNIHIQMSNMNLCVYVWGASCRIGVVNGFISGTLHLAVQVWLMLLILLNIIPSFDSRKRSHPWPSTCVVSSNVWCCCLPLIVHRILKFGMFIIQHILGNVSEMSAINVQWGIVRVLSVKECLTQSHTITLILFFWIYRFSVQFFSFPIVKTILGCTNKYNQIGIAYVHLRYCHSKSI